MYNWKKKWLRSSSLESLVYVIAVCIPFIGLYSVFSSQKKVIMANIKDWIKKKSDLSIYWKFIAFVCPIISTTWHENKIPLDLIIVGRNTKWETEMNNQQTRKKYVREIMEFITGVLCLCIEANISIRSFVQWVPWIFKQAVEHTICVFIRQHSQWHECELSLYLCRCFRSLSISFYN